MNVLSETAHRDRLRCGECMVLDAFELKMPNDMFDSATQRDKYCLITQHHGGYILLIFYYHYFRNSYKF